MKEDIKPALIVAYYLSRCDKAAWANLGYKSSRQGFEGLGKVLGVNPTTLRYRRDEFDAYNDNGRVGWLRPITGTRAKVVKAFQDTDDDTLLEIVKEIVENREFQHSEEYADIAAILSETADKKSEASVVTTYVARGKTGKAAEGLFKKYFEQTRRPIEGELIDRRDDGCGYDYEINAPGGPYLIEVKGLAAEDGSIMFTNKEWETARTHKEKYYVFIVRNVSGHPTFECIQNPVACLSPKKHIHPSIQVSWTISGSTLRSLRSQ